MVLSNHLENIENAIFQYLKDRPGFVKKNQRGMLSLEAMPPKSGFFDRIRLHFKVPENGGNMKKFKLLTLLIFVLTTLISCASVWKSGPSDEHMALIVGAVHLEAKGYEIYGDATVNGSHDRGIIITLYDTMNNEEYTGKSDRNGFFAVPVPAGSKFQIAKTFYKNEASNGSWASVWRTTKKIVKMEGNAVFNLGRILWNEVKDETHELRQQEDYEEVCEYYSEKHPESPWLNQEWKNISFK